MATFTCTVTATGSTTAGMTASFTGGDADFARWRYVYLVVRNAGGGVVLRDQVQASAQGGANNYFSTAITGLSSGTTYSYSATLYYEENDGSLTPSSYSASGSFTTPTVPPTPTTGTQAYLFDGTSWVPATPYIFDGTSWVQATPHIYDGGWN